MDAIFIGDLHDFIYCAIWKFLRKRLCPKGKITFLKHNYYKEHIYNLFNTFIQLYKYFICISINRRKGYRVHYVPRFYI